jgi:hypothetical protein
VEEGEDVRWRRVDRGLLDFLWSKRIISDQQYKVLKGNVSAGVNFAEVNGSQARVEMGRSRERRAARGQRAYPFAAG